MPGLGTQGEKGWGSAPRFQLVTELLHRNTAKLGFRYKLLQIGLRIKF